MAETFPYPAREHYEFPQNMYDQADEELRLYEDPAEFRRNIVALKRQYAGYPCMKAIEQYARFASVIKVGGEDLERPSVLNFDFFSGALMAVHVNVAPAPASLQRRVLLTNFLYGLDDDPDKETKIDSIKEWLTTWAGDGEDNWSQFLDEQSPEYQEKALALGAKLFEGREGAEERELDFIVGYTMASNLLWKAGLYTNTPNPV